MKVFFINGYPGSGKDTFVEICTELYPNKIMNIHTSTPAKQAMFALGWNGDKTPEVRRVMADLMKVSEDWKGPIRFVLGQLVGEPEIAFVHCREGRNMISYAAEIKKAYPEATVEYIAVNRPGSALVSWNNPSDAEAMNFSYDHVIQNRGDLVMLRRWAKIFLVTMGEVKIELLQDSN